MVWTTCFQCFTTNSHLIQYRYIDFKKLHTEISSLTRIIHEKPASTGSRASFHKQSMVHKERNAENKIVKTVICSYKGSQEGPPLRNLRQPHHCRLLSSCPCPQNNRLISLNDRIEPIYFQRKNRQKMDQTFFEFICLIPLGSPGSPWLSRTRKTEQNTNKTYIFLGKPESRNQKLST